MEKQRLSYIYALSAVFLWSSVATAFKLSLKFLSPLELLFASALVSWFVLGFLLVVSGEIKFLNQVSKKQIFYMLSLGVLNPFLYYLVLFKAYDILPAQEAQALNYTWALSFTYLSAFLLKQKLRWQDVVAGLICYLGVFIIATKGNIFSLHFENSYGVFLALLSTILWALFWIFNSQIKHPILGLFLNFTSGLVFISIAFMVFGEFRSIELKGLLGAIYVGFFEMGFTFFLWLQALRYTQSHSKTANLIFLSPFLSLVFISIFLKEAILPSTIMGLILIISALLFQQKAK
ncbi:MAG: EamA family transporter [Proteobacteria bacterium]|nr:MAG: EamA family transporter [Pseudomonadota bacterium]